MNCQCHHEHDLHSSDHSCCDKFDQNHKHKIIEISDQEYTFLIHLEKYLFLPLARFVMTSTKSEHLKCIALAPVYLIETNETLDHVNENSALLIGLQDKKLNQLDYDQPLQFCEYDVYPNSTAYQIFVDTVRDGSH